MFTFTIFVCRDIILLTGKGVPDLATRNIHLILNKNIIKQDNIRDISRYILHEIQSNPPCIKVPFKNLTDQLCIVIFLAG